MDNYSTLQRKGTHVLTRASPRALTHLLQYLLFSLVVSMNVDCCKCLQFVFHEEESSAFSFLMSSYILPTYIYNQSGCDVMLFHFGSLA